MQLKSQEKYIIRLCLERDLFFLFKESISFRNALSLSVGVSFLNKFNLNEISYQADSIDTLLFNDFASNLTEPDLRPIIWTNFLRL